MRGESLVVPLSEYAFSAAVDDEHEFYPFVTKYVRLGLALPYPHSQVLGLKVFGFRAHIAGGPSRRLMEFSERLRDLYAKQTPRK